jgi:hypothetical protein
MTLAQFTALCCTDQLAVVNQAGTHLATRWEGTTVILLYHLPGEVLAEVCYNTDVKRLTAVRASPRSAPLDAYARSITLAEELEGLTDV